MKNAIKIITAMALATVMLAISPMTDLSQSLIGGASGVPEAKAAESDKPLYISDIKIGNAYTDSEADPDKGMLGETAVAAQLESEGYTILRDGNVYANLNDGAGSKSLLKKGANDKIILLGYKTTTDPAEAITDLAVMNMNGGYSIEDYETTLKTHMDSQIKPFIDRFIAAINEYRENLKKSQDTFNYKRAENSRRLLNRFIDDDTGRPVGDLLIAETKYEMGDAAYNVLSAAEQKNHADILTMLMQGNAKAVLAIEMLLSRATDTSVDESWLDRFAANDLDSMVEETMAERPSLKTKKEIYAFLDKKYGDTARELQKKWEATADVLREADSLMEEAEESTEEGAEKEQSDVPSEIKTEEDLEKVEDAMVKNMEGYFDSMADVMKIRAYALSEYLDTLKYGSGTMLDFFLGEGEYRADDIRTLYPMVEALSEGQKEGLEFLSILDLLSIAVDDGDGIDEKDIESIEEASVYDGVNREIFEPGGVALTSEAMRAKASLIPEENQFSIGMFSPATWALYGSTVIMAGVAVGMFFAKDKLVQNAINRIQTQINAKQIQINSYEPQIELLKDEQGFYRSLDDAYKGTELFKEQRGLIYEREDLTKLQGQQAGKYTKIFVAVAVVAMVLILVSIASTLIDISDTYDVDFKTIPKYMVDEVDIMAYNEAGVRIFVNNQTAYYKSVTCNRVEGDTSIEKKNYETLLDRSDLNGDIGKQWLALYAVKYENGCPILADSLLYRKGGGDLPSGYSTGIHEFGGKAATNLNNKKYLFPDDPPPIHVFFKNAETSVSGLISELAGRAGSDTKYKDDAATTDKDPGAAGSLVAEGSSGNAGNDSGSGSGITASGIALGGCIGIVLGGIFGALIMYFTKRKKVTTTPDE